MNRETRKLAWLKPFALTTLLLFGATAGHADDTDIYFSTSAESVGKVNLLFLLDNSGSMAWCSGTSGYNSGCEKRDGSDKRINILKTVFAQLLSADGGLGGDVNVGLGTFSPVAGGYIVYPVRRLDDSATKLVAESAITKGVDDGYEAKADAAATYDSAGIDFPSNGGLDTASGLLFRNLAVPSHTVIKSATLTVDPMEASSTELNMLGFYSIGNGLPDLATADMNGRFWGPVDVATGSVVGVPVTVPGTTVWLGGTSANIDVTKLVQAAVNNGNWCGNDDMLLAFTNRDATSTASRKIGTVETVEDNGEGFSAASLHIEWAINTSMETGDKSCRGGLIRSLGDRNDDAEEDQNGQVKLRDDVITLADGTLGGFRFPDVGFTSSDTIKQAILHLPGAGAEGTSSVCKYYTDTKGYGKNKRPDWIGLVSNLSGDQAPSAGFECGDDITWETTDTEWERVCVDWGWLGCRDYDWQEVTTTTTHTYHTGDDASQMPLTDGEVTLHVQMVQVGSAGEIQDEKNDIDDRSVLGSIDVVVPADNASFGKTMDIDVTSLVSSIISGNSAWDSSDKDLMFVVSVANLPDSSAEFYISTQDDNRAATLTLQVASADQSSFEKNPQTVREQLISAVNNLQAETSTPLAEAFMEMGSYMAGQGTFFGDGDFHGKRRFSTSNPESTVDEKGETYISPIAPTNQSCATNSVIIMTDGEANSYNYSSHLDNVTGKSATGDSYDDMATVAKWLKDGATMTDENGNQVTREVTTNLIGFYLDNLSDSVEAGMKKVSKAGGGVMLGADSADSLLQAFQTIIDSVVDENASMAAPGVAVNQLNRMQYLSELYYAVFKPKNVSTWPGNLKKYTLDLSFEDDDDKIRGANNTAAVDSATGFFSAATRSLWSNEVDGNDAGKGGAHEVLQGDNTKTTWARKLFVTKLAGSVGNDPRAVTVRTADNSKVSQVTQASDLTPTQVGFSSDDSSSSDGRDDVYEWLMDAWGDPLHAEPQLVNYGYKGEYADAVNDTEKQKNVVFVAENAGILHAIDANSGEELFAFSPIEELLKDKQRQSIDATGAPPLPDSHKRDTYGLDSSWAFWRRANKDDASKVKSVYAYGGQRRGGHNYYALDVTDVGFDGSAAPTLMWQISPAVDAASGGIDVNNSGPFSILGQTWSQPQVAKIRVNGLDVPVLVFAGGYDTAQDVSDPNAGDSMGNAIYMVNAFTGALVWYASSKQLGTNGNYAFTQNTDMKWSIPSAPYVLDADADGYADFIYVGDMRGQVFRVDIDNFNNDGVGDSATKPLVPDVVTIAKLGASSTADKTNNRRFYDSPAVVQDMRDGVTMVQLLIGSGYRSQPLQKSVVQDYMFALDDLMALPTLTAIKNGSYDPEKVADTTGVALQPTLTTSNLANVAASTTSVEIDDSTNYGWKLALDSSIGEKALTQGFIADGQAVFSTFTAERNDQQSDACVSVAGGARLYQVNMADASAVDGETSRYQDVNVPGIPPRPQLLFGVPNSGDGDGDDTSAILVGTDVITPPEYGSTDLVRRHWYRKTN